ncbi:MAG TPA: hypothetical protein VMH91_03070 [Candidatus Paceibacterota bacterium]|nr:hypothetical protein [Candidatus Paceibacterota bacterium]
MKSTHGLLEKSALILVILIPLAFIAYATWGGNGSSSAPTSQVPTTTSLPTATISLNDPASLPTSIAAGQFASFSFTIKNTGSVSGEFPYKVSVQWSNGEKDVIDVNVASLSPGQSTTIRENLKFEVPNETAQVTLALTQSGQTVQFALPRKQ